MKLIKSIFMLIITATIITGCTKLSCGEGETVDGKFKVTVKAEDSLLSEVFSFVGKTAAGVAINYALPGAQGVAGAAAMFSYKEIAANLQRDQEPTQEEQKELLDVALKEAKEFIKNNPEKFCNKCKLGNACPARISIAEGAAKYESARLPWYEDDSNWELIITFDATAVVHCGECTDETCGKSTVSPANQKLVDAPVSCEKDPGITMVVIDEETIVPLDELIEIMAE